MKIIYSNVSGGLIFAGNTSSTDHTGDTFTCTNVRFTVDNIIKGSSDATAQTQTPEQANQTRYDQSVPLYGPYTNYFLGNQDIVKNCQSGATCTFYFNAPTGVGVPTTATPSQ